MEYSRSPLHAALRRAVQTLHGVVACVGLLALTGVYSHSYTRLWDDVGRAILDPLVKGRRAALGDAEAAYDLGLYYDLLSDDLVTAGRWYLRAAQLGHREAWRRLQSLCAEGDLCRGVVTPMLPDEPGSAPRTSF
jgi:hypothetical protein